ncbi:MAG: hypothetical protein AAFX56_08845, partial [Pseudomonadota bacterium]
LSLIDPSGFEEAPPGHTPGDGLCSFFGLSCSPGYGWGDPFLEYGKGGYILPPLGWTENPQPGAESVSPSEHFNVGDFSLGLGIGIYDEGASLGYYASFINAASWPSIIRRAGETGTLAYVSPFQVPDSNSGQFGNDLAPAAGLVTGLAGAARAAGGFAVTRAGQAVPGLVRLASGVGRTRPMQEVRTINAGETIDDIVNEAKALTFTTGNEHALVTLANGQRTLVSGGPGGISFNTGQITRIFGHTHPTSAPPSAADAQALRHLGQSKQYVFHGGRKSIVRP